MCQGVGSYMGGFLDPGLHAEGCNLSLTRKCTCAHKHTQPYSLALLSHSLLLALASPLISCRESLAKLLQRAVERGWTVTMGWEYRQEELRGKTDQQQPFPWLCLQQLLEQRAVKLGGPSCFFFTAQIWMLANPMTHSLSRLVFCNGWQQSQTQVHEHSFLCHLPKANLPEASLWLICCWELRVGLCGQSPQASSWERL